MQTMVILEAHVKTEYMAVLQELLIMALPDTRAYPGCQGLTVHVDQDNAQTVVFVEQWESRAAYEQYLAWRMENGTLAKLAQLLAEPPITRYFERLDV